MALPGARAEAESAQYAFVPLALRRDFKRGAESDDGAVEKARRTRSALLVSSLLHGADGQSQDSASLPKTTRRAKGSPATKPVATNQLETHPLYSRSIELAISKRAAFSDADKQLDAYFDGIRATVDELDRRDASTVPSWLFDPKIKLPTVLQLQRKIVQTVSTCLPECDVYLAMYEPLPMADITSSTSCPLLRFVAASPQSRMTGRVLLRGSANGEPSPTTSFDVLDSLDPALVEDIGEHAETHVRFFGSTDTSQIRTGPFACLPLVSGDGVCGFGILALDACRKATQLRPEAMSPQALFDFLIRMQLPEAAREFRACQFGGRQFLELTANDLQHRPAFRTIKIQSKQHLIEIITALRKGVPLHLPNSKFPPLFHNDDDTLAFLDDVCERAGKFLDQYRREIHWFRVLAKRTKDTKTKILDVYAALIQGVASALVGVERVCIWKIRDCSDIDVIATTHIPEERLSPFIMWNERQIRRVSIYVEDEDDHCKLLQGNVTRINLPPLERDIDQYSRPCERALYHVLWSNRTQQSLSWLQLRQLLPIRPMNARHYQLSQLLKKLCLLQVQPNSEFTMFNLEDPSALVAILHDPIAPQDVVYALQVDFRTQACLPQQAGISDDVHRFIRRAVAITHGSLACVRGREARSLRRQLSSVKTTRNFNSIGLTPSVDALRALDDIVAFVFQEISANLPGTQQQIAELQPDGAHLRFTFAANGSTLLGKSLDRGMGISFRCVDTRSSLVVDLNSELKLRLKWLGGGRKDIDADLPYVFIPLLHEDCCLGVLAVNRFLDVPKGRSDEAQPEDGVVEYLTSISKPLAAAIYLKRRSHALYTLQQLRLEPLQSPEQLFNATCSIVRETMLGVSKVRVVEIDFVRGKSTTVYDFSEQSRVQATTKLSRQIIPLSYRTQELLQDTVMKHWNMSADEASEMLQHCKQYEEKTRIEGNEILSKVGTEAEQRRRWEWLVRQRYYELRLRPLDARIDGFAGSKDPKINEHSFHARTKNGKYEGQALSTCLSSNAVQYARIKALQIGSLSGVFLATARQPQFLAMCEQSFVDRVADVLSLTAESLNMRIERSRYRVEVLERVKLEAAATVNNVDASLHQQPVKIGGFPLSGDEEIRVEGCLSLLEFVTRQISTSLDCPSVYIALHEPFRRQLVYVAASPKSGMKGKVLHRGHGVSFYALDSQQALVVTHTTQESIEQMCGHGSRIRNFSTDSLKWPVIVVPLGSVGILALDNLEKYARLSDEEQPEFGLVDFLRRAASIVGEAVAAVRRCARAHRRQRREDAIVRVMAACDDLGKSASPLYVQHIVLQAIETAFNGVDAYIGITQPLCTSILFTSATARSAALNHQVNTLDSVSFQVFISQRPLVIPRVEQHQFDASDRTAAKLVSQLRWFTPAQGQGHRGPFVCVPIPFVGVLCVDTFPGAASGIYSPTIPEHGVLDCLVTMSNLLGEHTRRMNAVEAARSISQLFEGNQSTLRDVFGKLLEIISRNVLTALELAVVCYDESRSWLPIYGAANPLVSQVSPAHSQGPNLASIEHEILQNLRTICCDEYSRCFCLRTHPQVIVIRCLDCRDVHSNGDGSVDWSRSSTLLKTAIVIRRANGVTWSYDQEFLLGILPLVDELVRAVNVRVSGIVARRNALQKLGTLSTELEQTCSSSTQAKLSEFLRQALALMMQAASQVPGDAYIGDRVIGGDSVEYIAASESSLMCGVHLSLVSAATRDFVSVTCLRDQKRVVIHLLEGKSERSVHQLSRKKAQRVFVAIPMCEDRLLCVDSLSVDAFDCIHNRLERDVEMFLVEIAALLESTISSVRYRFSYDQLCHLKTQRHLNMRKYFTTVHEILRRDVKSLHSQHILELADDFTGQFRVRSWHRFSTRRPTLASVPPHFCFANGCDLDHIVQDIHLEQHLALPMTNLPRTLDKSRAEMHPRVGREKQGAFACDCMALMLDDQFGTAPKLALCVFSHDRTSNDPNNDGERSTIFTLRQRQFFFAFSVVASEVYRHVFRACVLETFGIESLFIARDRLNAKDAVLLQIVPSESENIVRVVSACLVASVKWTSGSRVTSKLAERVTTFYHEWQISETDFSIVAAPTPIKRTNFPVSGIANISEPSHSTTVVNEVPTKASLFRRSRFFKSQEKRAPGPTIPASDSSVTITPPPSSLYEFHVLLRERHNNEVLSMTLEREGIDQASVTRQVAVELRHLSDEFRDRRAAFLSSTRGDEEWNGAGYGESFEIGEGGGCGGGGFNVLSCWSKWRDALCELLLDFESDIRGYLTGVHATSRDQLVHVNTRPGHLPSTTAGATQQSLFSRDCQTTRMAAVVIVRASLVLCGYKKEVAVESPADNDDSLLKEYLRASIGHKILELNPTAVAKWPTSIRAGNYLKSMYSTASQLIVLAKAGNATRAILAAQSFLYFELAFISAVKYFKFLEDSAKKRKQQINAVVIRIQCAYRVLLAKRMLHRLRAEFSAAVAIQCAFRQHLARRRRAFLRWTRAAVTVQRAYRRKLAKRRGRRPRRLTLELRTVAAQYGSMQAARSVVAAEVADSGEMSTFDSFNAFLDCNAGREQLKREEYVIAERLSEVSRHREQNLSPLDRLLADVHDIFELLDVDGNSELSRERTRELMGRLHVPLSGDEVDDVIDMMDNDQSGSISFFEFTNWFSHEFELLKKRSRDCGILSKRDRQWITEESARSALRKRWQARQKTNLGQQDKPSSLAISAKHNVISDKGVGDGNDG